MMKWNDLTETGQLDTIDSESQLQPVLLFKHSTRCSISSAAIGRLDREWKEEYADTLKPYYLDLLNHRDVSNAIAERYGITHESPQALVISGGRCILSQSHLEIRLSDLLTRG